MSKNAPTRAGLIALVDELCSLEQLIVPEDIVVIGLSGGPDSVFLLHALHQLQTKYAIKLIAAHLDHGWRENSVQDVAFCKQLCETLGIPFVAGHAADIDVDRKLSGSREDEGRQLRRAFFERVAVEYNATKIALAHHRDDLIETFFIRLLRGAGIAGLASIRVKQGMYIRPLLNVSKAEILTYLDEHAISYLTDPTNVSDMYLRNRIRLDVISALHRVDERSDGSIVRSIVNVQEAEDYLEAHANKVLNSLIVHDGAQQALNLIRFRLLEPFMQKRVLLAWLIQEDVPFIPTARFFSEVLSFMCRPAGGKHQLNPAWSLVKKGPWSWIEKKPTPD